MNMKIEESLWFIDNNSVLIHECHWNIINGNDEFIDYYEEYKL